MTRRACRSCGHRHVERCAFCGEREPAFHHMVTGRFSCHECTEYLEAEFVAADRRARIRAVR